MSISYTIPTEKILDRLRFENPWWKSGETSFEIAKMRSRLYFDLFLPLVEDRSIKRALILMGPRRVGKTVLMHQAIEKLIKQGIKSRSIIFISIDNPVYINMGLEELMKLSIKASGEQKLENLFIFFDEIQYLNDWERHLKILVDSYPKIKFIVSGSSMAALQIKSTESGAGRFHNFILPPLTFQEFLHLQDLTYLLKPKKITYDDNNIDFFQSDDINEVNRQFINYLNYGGYPEVIFNQRIQDNMSAFIKNDIIDKVLLCDLPSLYGIKDVQELNRFFTYLAYHSAKEFSLQKIAKESGIKKEFIKRYIQYLEAAFLIKVVNKVDENAKHFKRVTAFKVYLTNPSLRTALFSPLMATDDEMGHIVETAIFAQWMHRDISRLHYAKWKLGRNNGEVDMVSLSNSKFNPVWALEIKWSNRYFKKPTQLKSLLAFCKKNKLSVATITTIDKQGKCNQNGIELNFFPASLYAYVVANNTLEYKSKLLN